MVAARLRSRGAVLLPVVLTGLLSLGACTDQGAADPAPSTAATATDGAAPTPSTEEPSTPAGPPPSTAPVVGESLLPAEPVGQEVEFGNGLTATVERVEDVQLSAEGPGEVAGPGVAVTVSLRNGSDARIDLGGVLVSTTYPDGSPGDPSTSDPADVPTGILEPGEDADGTWVFSRPTGAEGQVEVTVSSTSSASVVVVRS